MAIKEPTSALFTPRRDGTATTTVQGKLRDGDQVRVGRSIPENFDDDRASLFEGQHQSQDASFVPRGTIVASRSGPVEIIPISTCSSSETKFR